LKVQARKPLKKTRQPEKGDHYHHAEKQQDGFVIYGTDGIGEWQYARNHHQRCADESNARTVDP